MRRIQLLVIFAVALVVSACGSDSADGAGDASPGSTGAAASDTTTLLCFFHANLTGAAPHDIDAFHEGELLGPDAPAAVADALFDLVEDPAHTALVATLDGDVSPVCS